MALWHVMYDDWQMECCGTPFSVGDEVAWQLFLREPVEGFDPAGWEGELSVVEGVVEKVEDVEDDEDDEDEADLDEEPDEDDGEDEDDEDEDGSDGEVLFFGSYDEGGAPVYVGHDEDDEDGEDEDEGEGEDYDDDEGGDRGWVAVVRDRGLTVCWGADDPLPERVRLSGLLAVEDHGARWPHTVGRVRAIHVVSQGFAETHPGSRTYEVVPGERRLRSVDTCPKWFKSHEEQQVRDGRGYRHSETGVLVELEVTPPGR
ncbi:DUF6578 domain-containing protein [Streptomyces sp. NPDC059009]|uniref:DUF6578 domain-containing protein n=1 Tax=Streptomyces sp. NPDC059009 TaxID=3346694 RepID=UPI00369C2098